MGAVARRDWAGGLIAECLKDGALEGWYFFGQHDGFTTSELRSEQSL